MTDDTIYTDLLIEKGDLVLDSGGNPVMIHDRAVIAQDIKHMIIESGLAIELVGEKSQTLRDDIKTKIELLIETEVRLISGTVQIDEPTLGVLWISATTRQFGDVEVEVTINE